MAKTNFRQIVNPDFIGAYTLDNQNNGYNEVAGTILRCELKEVTDMSGKAMKIVATNTLGKPMIIKATNGKVLQAITGSKYFEDWVNVAVVFYVELNVKSPQGRVDALRLKKQVGSAPVVVAKPELIIGTDTFNQAKAAVENGSYDLAKLKVHYTVSLETQTALNL